MQIGQSMFATIIIVASIPSADLVPLKNHVVDLKQKARIFI